MLDKEFLENLYIENETQQIVLENDGYCIIFYELDGNIVTIHQSNEKSDNFVCIPIAKLEKILEQLKSNK